MCVFHTKTHAHLKGTLTIEIIIVIVDVVAVAMVLGTVITYWLSMNVVVQSEYSFRIAIESNTWIFMTNVHTKPMNSGCVHLRARAHTHIAYVCNVHSPFTHTLHWYIHWCIAYGKICTSNFLFKCVIVMNELWVFIVLKMWWNRLYRSTFHLQFQKKKKNI